IKKLVAAMKTLFAILYPGIYILSMMLFITIVYSLLSPKPVFQIFSDARYIRNYMKKPQTFWDLPEPVKTWVG
ncbi:MAG: hypothetical protein NW226_26915, partial [Microscillaceae bacterium]|nr:hypothetical protein [Microscillaceae bacterium]